MVNLFGLLSRGIKSKKGCLTTTQSFFVNLKSNTMKKSHCKDKAFESILQVISTKNVFYNIYLTLFRDCYQFRRKYCWFF